MTKRHLFNAAFFVFLCIEFLWLLPQLRSLADIQLRFAVAALSLILLAVFSEIRYSYGVSGTIIWNKTLAAKFAFLSLVASLFAAAWTFPIFAPYLLPIVTAFVISMLFYQFRFRRVSRLNIGLWLILALAAVMLYWGAIRTQ